MASQAIADLRVVESSQGRHRTEDSVVARAMSRVISSRRGSVEWRHREPRGIAEQRHVLLQRATGSDAVLFLDDDVFMQPFVVQRLLSVLESDNCGFAGAFPAGLTFADDVRPDQQDIQIWESPVEPEVVEVEGRNWERWQLHRAANLHHVAEKLALPPGEFLRYKVAPTALASSTTVKSSSKSAASGSKTACRATTPARTSSSRTCSCGATAGSFRPGPTTPRSRRPPSRLRAAASTTPSTSSPS